MTKHIIDEIRDTERKLIDIENQYDANHAFLEDAGSTLSDEAFNKVCADNRRLLSVMNILSAHLGMLEADMEGEA